MGERMLAVPAAEVQRNFRLYQDKARTQPVGVTSRGRPRVVMISVEEYRRLKRRDRQALKVEELSEQMIEAIAKVKPPAAARKYDREVR